jgi:hypothetical protein
MLKNNSIDNFMQYQSKSVIVLGVNFMSPLNARQSLLNGTSVMRSPTPFMTRFPPTRIVV